MKVQAGHALPPEAMRSLLAYRSSEANSANWLGYALIYSVWRTCRARVPRRDSQTAVMAARPHGLDAEGAPLFTPGSTYLVESRPDGDLQLEVCEP